MNQPVYPQQPQWGQPPMQQPQQQWGQPPVQVSPNFQTGVSPQGYPVTQSVNTNPPIAGAAANNLFNQFLQQPVRQRADRAKPPDGTFVVRFTAGTKVDFSQRDGRPFLLLEYQVIEGTVPQVNGQTFGTPIFSSNRMQLEDLANIAKMVFGNDLPQVAAQAQGDPANMARFVAQRLAQGNFAAVKVSRNPKQVAQVGYEQAFANHRWTLFSPQPFTLAQVQAQAPQPQMQQPMPGMAQPQMLQPQGMPVQQQTYQPAPLPQAAPQQPVWQQPQQQAPQWQQPQQPQWQQPPQQFQQLPQAQPPQGAPMQLPQAQPPPSAGVMLPQATTQPPTQAPAMFIPGQR